MDNKVDEISETWGFFHCFTLSEYAKESWLNFEDLRKLCISDIDGNKCSFAVFKNWKNWNLAMRITIIAWDIQEFSRRLKFNILKLTDKKRDE
jgi:hypothetical protein